MVPPTPGLRDHLVAAADLVLGAACAGCGVASLDLCPRCRRLLRPGPRVVDVEGTTVAAAGDHEGLLRDVVIAWKRRGHTRLTPALGTLLATAVCALEPAGPLALVPVPTTRRSRRRRGADLVTDLADAAVRDLAAVGVGALVVPAVRVARTPADQVGLDAVQRATNLRGAFGPGRGVLPADAEVVVVDDVVTTGATIRETVRVIASTGVPVLGAAVVAARP